MKNVIRRVFDFAEKCIRVPYIFAGKEEQAPSAIEIAEKAVRSWNTAIHVRDLGIVGTVVRITEIITGKDELED